MHEDESSQTIANSHVPSHTDPIESPNDCIKEDIPFNAPRPFLNEYLHAFYPLAYRDPESSTIGSVPARTTAKGIIHLGSPSARLERRRPLRVTQ